MEVFYEASAKSGDEDSDVKIEWSVASDYPDDIKISDDGVMTVTENVQPGTEAEIFASLPEYFPEDMTATKKVKFIFTDICTSSENMIKKRAIKIIKKSSNNLINKTT
jgi:hypothetical protein